MTARRGTKANPFDVGERVKSKYVGALGVVTKRWGLETNTASGEFGKGDLVGYFVRFDGENIVVACTARDLVEDAA